MEKTLTFPTSPPSVITQIAQLSDMPAHELKDLWCELFHDTPPVRARNFIERRIAHQLQVRALRKHAAPLIENNEARLHALKEYKAQANKKNTNAAAALSPGTVLTRLYQGQEYTVTISLSGAPEFNGQLYRSLSEIARAITGTRWSGPVFLD